MDADNRSNREIEERANKVRAIGKRQGKLQAGESMKEMMEKVKQKDSRIQDLMKNNKALPCKLIKTSDEPKSQERENHPVEELMAELAKTEDTWEARVKDKEEEREDLLREIHVLEELNEKLQAENQELKAEEENIQAENQELKEEERRQKFRLWRRMRDIYKQ